MMYRYRNKMPIGQLIGGFFISLTMLTAAKSTTSSNLKKLKKGVYEENLAAYRIEWCKRPKAVKKASPVSWVCPLDQAKLLAQRLAQRKAAYEQLNGLKGYTIQLYMGSSRTAALKVQDLARAFSYPAILSYRQPHYTVQLGFFFDRLEAYLVYLTLAKKMPNAMIRPFICTKQAYLAAMLHPNEPAEA